ncbi:MAG: PBP1A family penicillin-binding protein [Acidimicrobiales bacterium]|nr:PBP1A family penicillin-binding protein [Hyphomonadaceae bacterium]RZV43815.1 MAG: PBP1A family penicillin-binding protein [Acidimicrobiales bacterium]
MNTEPENPALSSRDETPLSPYAAVESRNGGIFRRIFSPAPSKPKSRTKAQKRRFTALIITAFLSYFGALAFVGWIGWAGKDMPETVELWTPKSTPSIVILDRQGREILSLGGSEAKPVYLDDISPDLINALVAVEDKRFYDHPGFDVIGLARAMRHNLEAGRVVQGGSTITQQLAKNVFLTRTQTLKRKTQEIMLAVWIEQKLSKREILETYLSRVYFGGGTLGIESGAKRFFNKPAKDLTTGEAALLAGILKAPDRLNPLKNLRANSERTALVLQKMYDEGYVSYEDGVAALNAPIEIEPVAVKSHPSAGYFTDWILTQTDALIGAPQHDIVVRTTLDLDAQIAAQSSISSNMKTDKNAQQAALVAFDGTGGVRAMAGGVDYQHSSYNRAVTSKRQPGSAFKPFVYLAALEAYRAPWDVRIDEEVDIDGWKPGNFSNTFRGEMSLEKALALSINTISVILSEEIGRNKVVAMAQKMGLPELKPYRSLALGAQELSLYELTSAYVPLANWGRKIDPYGLEAIYAADGRVLYARPPVEAEQLLDTGTLGQINMMLQTVITAGTGKAARIDGRELAGKTGTTNDYRDAWFVGYAPDYVAGVWVGNDDNSRMSRVTGGTIPAQIWKTFMSEVLRDQPVLRLPTASRPIAVRSANALELLLADIEKSLPENN